MPDRPSGLRWFWNQAFGSDELTSYTAEYTWNSNQMAHAMMGFGIATVWILFAMSFSPAEPGDPATAEDPNQQADPNHPPERKSPVKPKNPRSETGEMVLTKLQKIPRDFYVVLLFLLIPAKEIVDVLKDRASFSGSAVSPNTSRLIFDSLTDISFWWTGMFFAAFILGWFVQGNLRWVVPLIGTLLMIAFWYIWAAPLWLNQKRTFDQSGIRFNYTRLVVLAAQKPEGTFFSSASPVKTWSRLEEFRTSVVDTDERPPQTHYVIYGGQPEDRTRLAEAMGSEYALRLRRGDKPKEPIDFTRIRYVSAPAAMEYPEYFVTELAANRLECVVIDDLDVSMDLYGAEPSKEIGEYVMSRMLPKGADASRRIMEGMKISPERQEAIKSALNNPVFQATMSEVVKTPTGRNQIRRAKFELLAGRVRDMNISTVWVLSGDRTIPGWDKRKDDWLKLIRGMIGNGKHGEVIEIELADPPSTGTPAPK